jgi:hypothetical protein
MQKKKFQVIKNTTNASFTGLDVDGRKMKFGRNGTFVVDAPGLASDIDKTYGRKGNQSVAVVPYNDHETRELGHRYKFAQMGVVLPDRKALIGKVKRVNGVPYVYVLQDGKMKLEKVNHVAR